MAWRIMHFESEDGFTALTETDIDVEDIVEAIELLTSEHDVDRKNIYSMKYYDYPYEMDDIDYTPF